MEQKLKISDNGTNLRLLLEFCMKEGEAVAYCKGDQLEHEGVPAWYFAYVECWHFKKQRNS